MPAPAVELFLNKRSKHIDVLENVVNTLEEGGTTSLRLKPKGDQTILENHLQTPFPGQ